ncbi:MAG: glycosyltransferase [Desulfobacterota bacterium]|nr:glycosyltransferase [Thermodesulfobacteriota bacterium]
MLEVLAPLALPAQVIVVDDDSPDGTAAVIREAFGETDAVRLIVRQGERGLATAIARGIAEARTEIIGVMDTDFNHHPRYLPGGGMRTSRFRYLGSWAFNAFIRTLLGSPIRDNLSGYLVGKSSLFRRLEDKPIYAGYGDYAIRLIYYALQEGMILREVPVIYEFRLGGESKTRFGRQLVNYTRAVLALRFSRGHE